MSARTIVIKIGTSTLTDASGHIARGELDRLVSEMSSLHKEGNRVILVSSGAVGTGAEKLGKLGVLKSLPEKQAAAAVGQVLLMEAYNQAFGRFGITIAQILLTRDAISDRHRYVNARNTFVELIGMRVIPIINENDSVAVEEIQVGDNDTLSALVASLIGADLLVNLTVTDGLLLQREGGSLQLIHKVEGITEEHRIASQVGRTTLGVGGMRTKLDAAELCMKTGITMVIANGKTPGVLAKVVAGETVGTRFVPKDVKPDSRKRWLLHGLKPKGKIVVDDGAAKALVGGGKSLLPAGIKKVSGNFTSGDLVSIVDGKNRELARGLASYGSAEAGKIAGKKSGEISGVLGYVGAPEMVHRDNLVLVVE